MTNRIDPREIEGLQIPGSAAVDAGAVAYSGTLEATDVAGAIEELAAAAGASTPPLLVSSANGEPGLVWDDNDQLVYAEGPTA